MRNKTFPIITLAIMMLLGACSNDEILPDPKPEPKTEIVRTISLTVNTPPEDDPSTRVALAQDGKNITLTWEVGDILELAFVQGTNKGKNTYTLKEADITNNGKRAQFDIVLPAGISGENAFDLYGVYGGGGLDDNNPTNVILPTGAGSAKSLNVVDTESVQEREDVVLYFANKGVNLTEANTNVAVTFKHLGSLFCITVKNTGDTPLTNLAEAQLVGVGGDYKWAYNAVNGGQFFDLTDGENGAFKNTESAGNNITFKTANNSLAKDETVTFWAWYPPTSKPWPALKLELRSTANSTIATSFDVKPARTSATAAGKSYYFYAIWDGADLAFTNSEFNAPTGAIKKVTVATAGTLKTFLNGENNTITALKVTGPINTADFTTMANMALLTYIDLEDAECLTIPEYAFGHHELANLSKIITTFILPTTLTSIGKHAFNNCIGLSGSLNLPAGLKTIGEKAFYNCSGLTGALIIPDGVTKISLYAFTDCSGFTGSLTIPNTVTWLGEYAFAGCTGFNGSLTLSNGLATIENNTFAGCSGFTGTLTLPDQLTTIKTEAFMGCSSLSGTLSIPSTVTSIKKRAFQNCSSFTGTLNVPSNLVTIGKEAFQNCRGFTGIVVLPISLKSIGERGFCGCLNVDAYRFPHTNPIFPYSTEMLCKSKTWTSVSTHRVQVPLSVIDTYRTASGWSDLHAQNASLIEGY